MRIVIVITVLLSLVLFVLLSLRSQIGLGGKDVRVKLEKLTKTPPKPVGLKTGNYGRDIKHGGLDRNYEMHVPTQAPPPTGYAVVLVFHGGGSYTGAIRYESRMDEVADRHGFIAVYPAGTTKRRFPTDRLLTWNDGRQNTDGSANPVDDVGFTAALLDDLAKFLPVDPTRVYAAGYSNGAQFTYRLVKQLPQRIAAIATVAGQRGPDEFFRPPDRPVSVMQFAGLEDKVGPYRGGSPARKVEFVTVLKPVTEVVREWAAHDGCPPQPAARTIGSAEELVYGPGREGSEVILWTLKNGGHTWPSGNVLPNAAAELGNINRDIFAADLMWEFFKKHPLNEKYLKARAR